MLRGCRWQLIALVVAAALFGVVLLSRLLTPPAITEAPPTATATPVVSPTITPNPGVLIPPQAALNNIATLREGVVGSVQRLNPLLAALNPAERDIASLIFEGLTATNQYGEPESNLAKAWVISGDGLEYIVTLRDDVLWQDGVPFTAADVTFTMSLLRAPDFPGPEALGLFWRTIETERLGDHLVRFRLTQPLGNFLDKLRIGILPEHALAGTPAAQLMVHPFNLSPIGTGPYQLEALRMAESGDIRQVDLRVAPVYRQRPEGQAGYAIDRLSFKLYPAFHDTLAALRADEIDGLAARNRQEREPLLAIATPPQFNTYTTLEPILGVLIFNWQRDETRFFREQRARLALEMGVDRGSVIERWLLNTAVRADSPLWPGSWAYAADLQWPPNDLNTARFLLETANLRTRSDDETDTDDAPTESPYLLSFDILAPDDPALDNMLEEIAAQWSQLNVSVQVEAADAITYQARLESGDFDAALVELSLGDSADPDVYAFWHQGQYPDGLNYGGVDDRRISEMLEKARRDPSGINRAIHYAQFQRDFVERAIAIPLYYPLYTYVVSADVAGVQLGFVGSSSDRFLTLQSWSINDS